MDGDDVIHSLATAVDTQLGVMASGQTSIPITAVNTPVSVAVTFPAGRFTAPPNMATTANAAAPQNFAVSVQTVTATGFLLWGNRAVGNTSFFGYWIAHQI
jgi:hypothetical protein